MKNSFYGNQYVGESWKEYFRRLYKTYLVQPLKKYIVNPLWKATKVTGFIIVSIFIFMLVANVLHATWFDKNVEASETATSTSQFATSTPEFPDFPPALITICTAESGAKHIVNGKVVRGHVDPDDIGICQINQTYWADEAHDLGFDIWDEEGNKKMAKWLFYNMEQSLGIPQSRTGLKRFGTTNMIELIKYHVKESMDFDRKTGVAMAIVALAALAVIFVAQAAFNAPLPTPLP